MPIKNSILFKPYKIHQNLLKIQILKGIQNGLKKFLINDFKYSIMLFFNVIIKIKTHLLIELLNNIFNKINKLIEIL